MERAKSASTRIALFFAVGAAAVISIVPVASAEVKTGLVSVRTGVSFRMVGEALDYRLYGIETCGISQVAHLNGVAWPCGAVATGWLTQLTLGYQIECLEEGRAPKQYATVLARCFLPTGEDIAKLALEEGLAWALHEDRKPIVREYQTVEQEARSQKRGLWSSNFMLGNQLYRR
jgi:endonuclease YncB( thermonuclease family)